MDAKRELPQGNPPSAPAAFRFGDFTFDPLRGGLLGPDGAEIELRPKSAEVLCRLVECGGQLVSREQLMHAVWPDVFVTDDNITQCVAEIRRALRDEGAHLVRTLPKRGYLLAAEVSRVEHAPLVPERKRGTVQAEPAAERPALPLPDRPSLAVLPFANLSGDPAEEYFADGMTEDITTALSRIRWLFVIARNSAFAFRGRAKDVREIGRELGVRYLLAGSVRKAAGRVRIACQLVEAESGLHVWADRFEGELGDIFDLQDRVAESLAGAIEPSLQRAEIERARSKPTESLDAYDLFLRSLPHHYVYTKSDSDAALALLRRAIDLDPGFALAKAFMAYTVMIREVQGWLELGDREEGEWLVQEAILDPRDDPATLRCAGQAIAWLLHDRERALVAVERALALNHNSAQVLGSAGWTLTYAGQAERAIEIFHRALRLSPLDPEISYFLSGLGYAYLMARRFEDALEVGRKAVAQLPDRGTGYRVIVAALQALGRGEEARAAARRYRQVNPSGCRVFADRVSATFADRGFVVIMVDGLRAAGIPE